jgi:hypothetical protein
LTDLFSEIKLKEVIIFIQRKLTASTLWIFTINYMNSFF